MHLSDRQTASQSDVIRRANFDRWALIAVRSAEGAAVLATDEQVRSLRALECELTTAHEPTVWECIAAAWHQEVFEASGNDAYATAGSALWELVTCDIDAPALLWRVRDRVETGIDGLVAAITFRARDVARHGMREHVRAVRTALRFG